MASSSLAIYSKEVISDTNKAEIPQTREELRMKRGLSNLTSIFIPKGIWMVGGSLSYSTHDNSKYSLVLVENIDSYGYTFKFSPVFSYAIKNNMAVGGRFNYKRNLIRLYNSDIKIGDPESGGINMTMDDYYGLTQGFSVIGLIRQYIPLGHNKRFALFNEIQLEYGYSQSKFSYDSPIQGTYATTHDIALNLAPGIIAFATNRTAVEINVGVLGVNHARTKQVHNQVEVGKVNSSLMNFKINILSISFGVAHFF